MEVLIVYSVTTRTTMSGRVIAILAGEGRYTAGAASVPFIEWMSQRVPRHQLSAEQTALVRWYEKRQTAELIPGSS